MDISENENERNILVFIQEDIEKKSIVALQFIGILFSRLETYMSCFNQENRFPFITDIFKASIGILIKPWMSCSD